LMKLRSLQMGDLKLEEPGLIMKVDPCLFFPLADLRAIANISFSLFPSRRLMFLFLPFRNGLPLILSSGEGNQFVSSVQKVAPCRFSNYPSSFFVGSTSATLPRSRGGGTPHSLIFVRASLLCFPRCRRADRLSSYR